MPSPLTTQPTPRQASSARPTLTLQPATWEAFVRSMAQDVVRSLIQICGIVIVYLLLRAMLFRLIDGILSGLLAREVRLGLSEERTARLHTLQGLCKSILSYVLFFVFGVMLLKAIGFDILPFVETAGVIGLAIGFGAQKLVKDVISGFFVIVDNLYVVGDVVTIGAITGTVQEMGMRVTRLLDVNGRLYLISNGDIGTVTNLSRHPVVDFVEINVGPAADLSRIVEIVRVTGEQIFQREGHRLKAAPYVLGITAFSALSVTVRVAVAADPRDLPAEQMRLREALRTALLAAEITLA